MFLRHNLGNAPPSHSYRGGRPPAAPPDRYQGSHFTCRGVPSRQDTRGLRRRSSW
ncbi:hypothetical protein DPMN_161434 [Dreissena polymorpha]|uniref:Uncharacterized protein n=1 Tax=Dreissena polymorpha TaxID=45954 RepID=A0A9D4EPM7_DREPO|nr:hypothetical protein DPMN_161434 [Dreissena polymorpha]